VNIVREDPAAGVPCVDGGVPRRKHNDIRSFGTLLMLLFVSWRVVRRRKEKMKSMAESDHILHSWRR